MKKEFNKCGIVICRGDYESLPCAMCASEFTDKQMEDLVNNIYCVLHNEYGYTDDEIAELYPNMSDNEDFEDAFWKEMEECAVNLGMRYYDDMCDAVV